MIISEKGQLTNQNHQLTFENAKIICGNGLLFRILSFVSRFRIVHMVLVFLPLEAIDFTSPPSHLPHHILSSPIDLPEIGTYNPPRP